MSQPPAWTKRYSEQREPVKITNTSELLPGDIVAFWDQGPIGGDLKRHLRISSQVIQPEPLENHPMRIIDVRRDGVKIFP